MRRNFFAGLRAFTSNSTSVVVALAVVWFGLLMPSPSLAHVADPTLERGFSPNQVYQFNDLDSVNLFNGNLAVNIPIGPVYRVGGDLSYQLRLVYNSKIWDFEYDFACTVESGPIIISGDVWSSLELLEMVLTGSPDGGGSECFTIAIPNRKSNAGTGWTLGFGQLYPPPGESGTRTRLHGATAVNDTPGWLYVSPDGAEHRFYNSLHGESPAADGATFYTRDGSFLRLKKTSGIHVQIQMPDGIVQTFEQHTHLVGGEAGPETHWRFVEMKDPFGNRMSVNYLSDLHWEITDSSSSTRKHTVRLAEREFSADPDFEGVVRSERVVESVTLAGPPGAGSSVYRFFYGPTALPPADAFTTSVKRGCPNNWDGEGTITSEKITSMLQLTRLQQPDETSFDFDYTPDETPTAAFCSRNGGRLERMTLPTGGGVEYEYGPFVSARDGCHDPDRKLRDGYAPSFITVVNGVGVMKRREASDLGDPDAGGTTKYLRYFGGDWSFSFPIGEGQCDRPKTGVTAVFEPPVRAHPAGTELRRRVTLNYFSIFQGGGEWNIDLGMEDPGYDQLGWQRHEYGMPFTRESSDFGPRLPEVARDPADPERLISREVFDCPVPEDNADDPTLGDPTDPDGTPFTGFDRSACTLLRRVFAKYETDPLAVAQSCGPSSRFGACTDLDRRLVEERTYFLDDPVCTVAGETGQPCYRGMERETYDGLGNFRTTESVSGFGPTRTVWTNFNPGFNYPADPTTFTPPAPTGPWILDTFPDRNTREDGTRIFFENFDFAPATGFLKQHQRHRGTDGAGTSLASLTTSYEDDGKGNVIWEKYSGGDDGNAVASLDYVIHHDYLYGVLQRSEYRDPQSQMSTVLRFVDRDIDAATGLMTASRDSAGITTNFAYDSMWRLASVTPGDVADAKTAYQYQPASGAQRAQVTVVTQRQNGGVGGAGAPYCAPYNTIPLDGLTQEEYEYDGLGRVVRARTWMPDGMIAEVATDYAPQGGVVRQTTPYDACVGDAPGRPATETGYDVFGRPETILAPDRLTNGARTTYDYFGERREIRFVHGLGADGTLQAKTSFTYDQRGRLKTVTDAANGNWRYDYDQGDRLVRVRHKLPGSESPLVTRRTFNYDSAGLLLSETHPELAGTTLFHGGYDARGNPGTMRYGTVGSSFDLDFTYDAAERNVRVTQNTTQRPLIERFYGRHGSGTSAGKPVASKRHNLFNGRDVVVSRTNSYLGPSGRLSRQRLTTGGEFDVPRTAFETFYTYDPLGNVASIDYPDCSALWCSGVASLSPNRLASFDYENGLLSGVNAHDSVGAFRSFGTLGYHRDGLVGSIAHANGSTDTVVDDPHAMGRPSSMSASGPGGSLWSSGTYAYDGAGNIRGLGIDDTFDYDLLHRLVSANVRFNGTDHTQTYTYDYFGNMVSLDGDPFFSTSATNRISVWTYDTAGNVVRTDGDYSYEWDALGAMTRAVQTSGSPDRRHLYDAAGERVAVLHLSGGDTTRELWSLRGTDNRVLRDVEYLPVTETSGGWQWLKDYLYRGTGLLASVSNAPSSERHYHLDHLGTTRAISNAGGLLISRHKYLPFGEEIEVPVDIATERMRFTGHERDDLGPAGQFSDLDYMHARYYRQSAARFLSVDPAEGTPDNPQSWNKYSYVSSNPLRFTDPNGAYQRDFHYEVTLLVAYSVGLSLERANRIAVATQGVDEGHRNPLFPGFALDIFFMGTRDPRQNPNRLWHFASPETLSFLAGRALNGGSEKALGDFLHPLQDSFSHADFMKQGFHSTQSPDLTHKDPLKALFAAKETYEVIRTWAETQGIDLRKQVPFDAISGHLYDLLRTKSKSLERRQAVSDLWERIETLRSNAP